MTTLNNIILIAFSANGIAYNLIYLFIGYWLGELSIISKVIVIFNGISGLVFILSVWGYIFLKHTTSYFKFFSNIYIGFYAVTFFCLDLLAVWLKIKSSADPTADSSVDDILPSFYLNIIRLILVLAGFYCCEADILNFKPDHSPAVHFYGPLPQEELRDEA